MATDEHMELEKIPQLELAQLTFTLASLHRQGHTLDNSSVDKWLTMIKQNEMAVYYDQSATSIGLPLDQKLSVELKEKNQKQLAELNAAISDAEGNLSETEVRDAYYKKAVYLCRIGDKESAVKALHVTYEKTVGVGKKIDIVLFLIRIGLFYSDHAIVIANLAKAKDLLEQGGDWDRKNRLKAYEGLYCLSVRDFKKAADLLLDATSTFTSYELMSYEQLTFYAIISAMPALERNELRDKVIKGAEVQEQLHGQKELQHYLMSLYDCNYADFFVCLASIEQRLKADRFLSPHYVYYTRAMRIKAYKQLISSYRSLTLEYMADAFGVSIEFIDKELHQLISTGDLPCKIDSVKKVVETSQLDARGHHFQSTIKHGDILLNRIQKLSHVINV